MAFGLFVPLTALQRIKSGMVFFGFQMKMPMDALQLKVIVQVAE